MKCAAKLPNIVIMYADDLGFGDVGCYGATRIPTLNIDRLAAGGIKFTRGYAAAATCTPSRYSLLTGSYPWRNSRANILPADAPLIIPPGILTLPAMLKQAGYQTGIVGKWHLGLGKGDLDWNKNIAATPLDVGFDYSFIMPATNDRVPCVYVEGRRVVGLDPATDPLEVTYDPAKAFPGMPTGRNNPELLTMKYTHGHDMSIVNGISRIGFMRGGAAALWKDEQMAQTFLDKALAFIRRNKETQFFLYYAFHQPHVPRVPARRFAGATALGPRGDVIAEMDWCVGELIQTLENLNLRDNTIVIFSSDNGPVLDDGYADGAAALCGDHRPAGPLRGGKYSLFDGGTRVPFILSWPAAVRPCVSHALVCHTDFLASFAALTGVELEPQTAPDSFALLPALLGKSVEGRTELVTEGIAAKTVLHSGDLVYIPPHDGPAVMRTTGIETGNCAEEQLYDLSMDIGQIKNMARARKADAELMRARLATIRESKPACAAFADEMTKNRNE